MTARVMTLKGPTAGAYYVEALPSYYLDPGEPKGVWHGTGAHDLGLTGTVDDETFLRIMNGLDPTRDVNLGRAFGDTSVRGFDVTASAPKSVSVLFALGDDHTRAQVLAAHDAAVGAMIGWIEDHAHTRYRINGEIAVVDADGIIAAAFRQHTSRALDPQLHTHVVVANRVLSPDGRWLALDARTLKLDQRTLSALYHSGLRAELSSRLGVRWQPVENGIAEIADVAEPVLEEFSTRTVAIERRLDHKINRFIDTFDRDPTPREHWQLEREAVLDTRPAKTHPANHRELHDEWAARSITIGHHPNHVTRNALGHGTARSIDHPTAAAAIDTAIAALSEKQSTWRTAEVTREIAAALPTGLDHDAGEMIEFIDRLTDIAISRHCLDLTPPAPEHERLRRDGRPITESSAQRLLTTPAILEQEERLLAWAQQRAQRSGTPDTLAPDRSSIPLNRPQADTAAAAAGTEQLVIVIGPAGSGKTTALAPAVELLRATGRPVFGVAPSAAAAEVLAAETGVNADTLDKLLIEHSLPRPPDHTYDLPFGTTLIVDEAGMIPTPQLASLAELADHKHWRIILTGDPRQFSPVGRGGMFELLATHHPGLVELDQVHRFTHPWERDASLRLRDGDPAVLHTYAAHGRLHSGSRQLMDRQALDAWQHHRRRGETVLLTAPTNTSVERLNQAAQQRRLQAGELNPDGPSIIAGPYRLHVGDEIVTRQNDRHHRTNRGYMIRNRDTWTITHIHPDGDVTATGPTGTTRLPRTYTEGHVELGYAQTSHASQGRTVDHGILILDTPTDHAGIYVPLTRGRHSNTAYVNDPDELGPQAALELSIARETIERPSISQAATYRSLPDGRADLGR